MNDEQQLIEKLQRIEALFARPGTEGEKIAAAHAADRIRQRLSDMAQADPPVEYQFSAEDGWSRQLLVALMRRYGISPYQYARQRRTTVMARVSRRFVDETLWPEYLELSETLEAHLAEITQRIISQAIFPDAAEEVRTGEESPRPALG